MQVIKRNGNKQSVQFDKITARISRLCYGLDNQYVDPICVAQKVCAGVFDGVSTSELDELASETAAFMCTTHPDYTKLASRISVANLHKHTCKSFFAVMTKLSENDCLDQTFYEFVCENRDRLDSEIVYERDFDYDFFGFKTLEKSYLVRMARSSSAFNTS